MPPGNNERVYTAVFTLKEAVGLLKNDGRAALGALVFDGNGKAQWSSVSRSVSGINIFLRIDCRTWNPEGFPHHTWGRTWASVSPLPDTRIANRTLLEPGFHDCNPDTVEMVMRPDEAHLLPLPWLKSIGRTWPAS